MKKLLVAAIIALATIAVPAFAADDKKAAPAAEKKAAPAPEKKTEALMDINSVSEKELATLPGIGEAAGGPVAVLHRRHDSGHDRPRWRH